VHGFGLFGEIGVTVNVFFLEARDNGAGSSRARPGRKHSAISTALESVNIVSDNGKAKGCCMNSQLMGPDGMRC
jgi:hypothetical protein